MRDPLSPATATPSTATSTLPGRRPAAAAPPPDRTAATMTCAPRNSRTQPTPTNGTEEGSGGRVAGRDGGNRGSEACGEDKACLGGKEQSEVLVHVGLAISMDSFEGIRMSKS
jgi:hypothetical protein